jgi:hypothetical protein
LLHTLGFLFQKVRFVSDHLDTTRYYAWLPDAWPAMLCAAKQRHGLLLFDCAPWDPVGYPWARRGQQPEVKTSELCRLLFVRNHA